ncbi:secreted ookinete adhesive protein, putative [Plasmodium ovale curtisi]|uniref:Secreted ookinete adhesive protein, putative n=1 Tax=Plasmodium ovale curtisi TaxID=864141 RepID=A0A1A8X271_PLAOA|nr:secreted ookinete adhesive protein, putative [Plasmodium ovale curtisi]SBS97816.1 secreted ookinete adhesive protein, putative [Plasmodium ovale curtisi]
MRSAVASPHNHHKVTNFSAIDIFEPRITQKECIKCLPDNFCECECSCKNKTGFSMKYRNASTGTKLMERGMYKNKKTSRSRQCIDLPIENSQPGTGPETEPETEPGTEPGTEPETETEGKPEIDTPDNEPIECTSSCKSVTGVQTEECSCSCFC